MNLRRTPTPYGKVKATTTLTSALVMVLMEAYRRSRNQRDGQGEERFLATALCLPRRSKKKAGGRPQADGDVFRRYRRLTAPSALNRPADRERRPSRG